MPGAIIHLAAGSLMVLIGIYYSKDYFRYNHDIKEFLLLIIVCLSFSLLPDFVLIIYYTTYMSSFCTALLYHNFFSFISAIVAISGLLILRYWIDIKRKPILIMGLWCIILHVAMDLFIEESSIWF